MGTKQVMLAVFWAKGLPVFLHPREPSRAEPGQRQAPGLPGSLARSQAASEPYWILSLVSQAPRILCTKQHFWKS